MLQVLRIRPSRHQRSLAAAFVGEIAAILRSMDDHPSSRNHNDQEQAPERANGSCLPCSISALPRFTIYESNAQKIADFDGKTARELAFFYTCAATLSERLRSLPSQVDSDDRKRCIQLVNSDAECLLEAGDQVLRRLRPLVSHQSPASITRA
jgi:hypothetical protein